LSPANANEKSTEGKPSFLIRFRQKQSGIAGFSLAFAKANQESDFPDEFPGFLMRNPLFLIVFRQS